MLCVSLSDLDRQLRYTRASDMAYITYLQDALGIAEELGTHILKNVPIYVVFTKPDVLQQRVSNGASLRTIFGELSFSPDDYGPAVEALKAAFVKAVRGATELHFYTCCALDAADVARMWQDITHKLGTPSS